MFDEETDFKEYQAGEFTFKKFSSFCPEQWYIYHNEEIIGYVRSRWDVVRVDYYKTGYDDYEKDFSRDNVDVILEKNSDFDSDEERIKLFNQVGMILSEKLGLLIPVTPEIQKEFQNSFDEFCGFSFRSETFLGSEDKDQIKNWIETAFQMGYLFGIKK